jgi:hypothetical protein
MPGGQKKVLKEELLNVERFYGKVANLSLRMSFSMKLYKIPQVYHNIL